MATKVPDRLETLSDEKLQELWAKVAEETLERREANKRVAAEVNRRSGVASAQAILDSMNDLERAQLRQLMGPEGIESEEVVHNG